MSRHHPQDTRVSRTVLNKVFAIFVLILSVVVFLSQLPSSSITNNQPHVYLKCGHVHGLHSWNSPDRHSSTDKRTCPVCLQVGLIPRGEGVLLGILGRGVPPGSPNPDPISDQNMPFSTPFSDLP